MRAPFRNEHRIARFPDTTSPKSVRRSNQASRHAVSERWYRTISSFREISARTEVDVASITAAHRLARIYRIDVPFTRDEIVRAMVELVKHNGVWPCYIRPIVLRGYGEAGVNPFNSPTEVYICNYPWGKYLGTDATEGVDVCVSSWTRIAPNTLPAMAKSGANYMNSQLIKMEAIVNGYAEGIALDVNGYVSEGSGENLFVVRNGVLHTAPLGNSVLPGITRDSVLQIARDLGIKIVEQQIPRESLYIADEVFFTGTAAEITPIRSVDKITVGKGKLGPVTKSLQAEFYGIVRGEKADRYDWLTPVVVGVEAAGRRLTLFRRATEGGPRYESHLRHGLLEGGCSSCFLEL